jgi:hypothetical protein
VQNRRTHALCDLDVVDQFVIHSKPEGVFAKRSNSPLLATYAQKCEEERKGGELLRILIRRRIRCPNATSSVIRTILGRAQEAERERERERERDGEVVRMRGHVSAARDTRSRRTRNFERLWVAILTRASCGYSHR